MTLHEKMVVEEMGRVLRWLRDVRGRARKGIRRPAMTQFDTLVALKEIWIMLGEAEAIMAAFPCADLWPRVKTEGGHVYANPEAGVTQTFTKQPRKTKRGGGNHPVST